MAESLSWRKSCAKSECKNADEFSYVASRLQRLVYRDTGEFRSQLNTILDELNSLDYSAHSHSEEVNIYIFNSSRRQHQQAHTHTMHTVNDVTPANTQQCILSSTDN